MFVARMIGLCVTRVRLWLFGGSQLRNYMRAKMLMDFLLLVCVCVCVRVCVCVCVCMCVCVCVCLCVFCVWFVCSTEVFHASKFKHTHTCIYMIYIFVRISPKHTHIVAIVIIF